MTISTATAPSTSPQVRTDAETSSRHRGMSEGTTMTTTAAPALPLLTPQDRDLPCQSHDSELWFAESPADVEYAKGLCGQCPVRATCLQGALQRGEPWGVWGGELLVAGRVVPRKRPRGRPRKHPVAA